MVASVLHPSRAEVIMSQTGTVVGADGASERGATWSGAAARCRQRTLITGIAPAARYECIHDPHRLVRAHGHMADVFTAEPSSVAIARNAAVRALTGWAAPELVDPVDLIVSELVTNSIKHARSCCVVLGLDLIGEGVKVSVIDHPHLDGIPVIAMRESDGESGRGLFLVNLLTSGRWVSETGRLVETNTVATKVEAWVSSAVWDAA
jgi:anti-sigma regulatory factor (Ser/Thr protein kinase)